jgi:hypothetical protein
VKTKTPWLLLLDQERVLVTLLPLPGLLDATPGGGAVPAQGLAAAVASPVLPPRLQGDPGGDRLLSWLLVAVVPWNSLGWDVALLLWFGWVHRFAAKPRPSETLQPPTS